MESIQRAEMSHKSTPIISPKQACVQCKYFNDTTVQANTSVHQYHTALQV